METIFHLKWQILVIIEFLIILFLFWKRKINESESIESIEFKKYKRTNLDMKDLMKDLNLSKSLYKELSRKYHPDKFIGSPFMERAQEIFQTIQQNKTNYKKLLEIKESAELELKIN
jgi:hypothetical protein